MEFLIYSSLMVLALGLLTSISLLALSHIFIIVPALFYLFKTDFKAWSKSTWALVAMTVAIILSITVNQDIAHNGYAPLTKTKYFIIGILSIAPFSYYFKKNGFNEKKIKYLLYAFCIATTLATFSGLISMLTGIGLHCLCKHSTGRNSGVFGMVMNYAHNLSYFEIIIMGLLLSKEKIEKYINYNFLIFVFIFNLLGLYKTFTRGAWLAFLVGAAIFFLKKNFKKFMGVLAIVGLIGIAAYFVAGDSMYRDTNDTVRIGQWQGAIAAFKERPVLGVGYLNFEHIVSEIKTRYGFLDPEFSGHAHNNFFEMLASTGALGFLSYLGWIIFWFFEMYKRDDMVGKIGAPFVVAFVVGGLTQSTISLGINLFFVMAAYSVSQINFKLVKD